MIFLRGRFIYVITIISIVILSCGREPETEVTIRGNRFYINGVPSYQGKTWNGNKIEGLLFNSRMVQGIFDDDNPETELLWKYPDTGTWDPDRNTDEFVRAMEEWRSWGMLAFTINLQGGSPTGYGNSGWINSAFNRDGTLKPEYFKRLDRILSRADDLGMIAIIGIFYFGQDQELEDEAAVINAVDNFINWLFIKNYRNILIEINNECDVQYDHEILQPARIGELIARVKRMEMNGFRYYVSTSFGGGTIPTTIGESDFILLHGNGVDSPEEIREMVKAVKRNPEYNAQPVIFNEDDHYDFDGDDYNMKAAIESYASWGFFDYRHKDEDISQGFQSVPVDWGINSDRKRSFFEKVKEITGAN